MVRRVSGQWGNNTDLLPCVIWPFHLLWINQMWLDSLHKFHRRALILSLCKRGIVVGRFMKQVLLVKCLWRIATILWQTFALEVCLCLEAADKSPTVADACVQQTARSLCPTVYLSQTQWQWCLRKAWTWMLTLRKGTNPVGRKSHCGYLQVDDNKNIALHDRFEVFVHSRSCKQKPKQTLLS